MAPPTNASRSSPWMFPRSASNIWATAMVDHHDIYALRQSL
jgi:hypothetical protein